jgi:hypothetical protein
MTDLPQPVKMPALHRHALALWEAMQEEAAEGVTADGALAILWEGRMTSLFDRCGIGRAKYSEVLRLLEGVGAIVQQQRGARDTPSIWALDIDIEITPEKLEYVSERFEKRGGAGKRSTPTKQTAQQVKDLARQVQQLTQRVERLERVDNVRRGEEVSEVQDARGGSEDDAGSESEWRDPSHLLQDLGMPMGEHELDRPSGREGGDSTGGGSGVEGSEDGDAEGE